MKMARVGSNFDHFLISKNTLNLVNLRSIPRIQVKDPYLSFFTRSTKLETEKLYRAKTLHKHRNPFEENQIRTQRFLRFIRTVLCSIIGKFKFNLMSQSRILDHTQKNRE